MRLALIAAITTGTALGACAPLQPEAAPYGYGYGGVQPAPAPYSYYDGGYAQPPPSYYEPQGYGAPYGAVGPAIIVGGERHYDDRERYRYSRPDGGGYRGVPNQPPPGRDFGGQQGRSRYDNARSGPERGPERGPGPVSVAAPRPGPIGPGPTGPGPIGLGPQRSPTAHAPEFDPANPTAHGGDR